MNLIEKYPQARSGQQFVSMLTGNLYINVTPIENEPSIYVGLHVFDGEQYRIPGHSLRRLAEV